MAQIAAAGRPQKDIRIQIGEDSYEKQVSDVNFAPTTPGPVVWQGGTPDAKLTAGGGSADWVLNVTAIQAWDDPDSFVRFALENEGEEVQVSYQPHADDTFTVTSTVTIVAPQIGGPVNQYNESTLSMPATKPATTTTTTPTP